MEAENTSLGLLHGAQTGNDGSWKRLLAVYEPLIAGWARKHAATQQDAEDLAQEILLEVCKHLPRFEYRGQVGAFRAWLRILAAHTTSDFWTARRRQPQGTGDSEVLASLHQLADSGSDLANEWDREHDRAIVQRLLEMVGDEFTSVVLEAFRRQTLEGVSGQTVARELGVSVGAVYTAKSRVLQRLRQLSEGILSWDETGKIVPT